MPSQEEIDVQLQLLATYRHNLARLLQQAAKYGGEVFAPPQTANGIAEVRTNIQRIKETLRGWGVHVDDHPDDEIKNSFTVSWSIHLLNCHRLASPKA